MKYIKKYTILVMMALAIFSLVSALGSEVSYTSPSPENNSIILFNNPVFNSTLDGVSEDDINSIYIYVNDADGGELLDGDNDIEVDEGLTKWYISYELNDGSSIKGSVWQFYYFDSVENLLDYENLSDLDISFLVKYISPSPENNSIILFNNPVFNSTLDGVSEDDINSIYIC